MLLLALCAVALQVYDVTGFVESDCADQTPPSGTDTGPCAMLSGSSMTCQTDLHTMYPTRYKAKGYYVSLVCPVTCDSCGPGPFGVVLVLFWGYGMA